MAFYVISAWIRLVCISIAVQLFTPSPGVEGTLTTVPVNALAIGNQTARLNCTTNAAQYVYWKRILTGSTTEDWIYNGKNGFDVKYVDDRFSIDADKSTGKYDLIIDNVRREDAGQYICVDELGTGQSAAAEIVVIGSMHCDTDTVLKNAVMANNIFGIKEDRIQLTCSLEYKGNIEPSMDWKWPGSETQSETPVVTKTSNSASSTLNLSPTRELNNATIKCETSVDDSRDTNKIVIWESLPISVRYAEFEAKPVPECPGHNWSLICNPECLYAMVNIGDKSHGKLGLHVCQYTYYHESKAYVYSSTYEDIKCEISEISPLWPISVSILSVIAVGLCFGLCVLKRKTKQRRNKDRQRA